MKRITLNIILVCFMACTSLMAQEKTDAYFNQVAEDICDCSDGMLKIQEKAKVLQKTEKYDELKALLVEIEKTSSEFEYCINGLMVKYPEIEGNKEYEARAEKALEKVCPAFGEMMGNANEEISTDGTTEDIEELDLELVEIEEVETAVETEEVFKTFALGICDCVEKESGLKAEFQELKAKGDKEQLNLFRRAIPTKYPGLVICLNKAAEKNATISEEEPSAPRKLEILNENCPMYLDLLELE